MSDKDTRTKIIDCALKGFMQKGYKGISLTGIARELGLTKGGIYHYFSNKDDLYYHALKHYFDDCTACYFLKPEYDFDLEEEVKRRFSDIHRSRQGLKKQVGSDADNAILQFYAFLFEATRRFPEFQKQIDYLDAIKRSKLTDALRISQEKGHIRRDIDPELTAFEIDALIQQTTYLSFVNPAIKKDDDFPRRLFDNYWPRLMEKI